MLQVSQLLIPVDHADDQLRAAAAEALAVPVTAIQSMRVKQRAVDARMRKGVLFCYTLLIEVSGEAEVLQRSGRPGHVEIAPDETYRCDDKGFVIPQHAANPRVIIVGTGPCGLFCGLLLARHGFKPLLLERGKQAGPRARDVTGFWRRGLEFNPESNVQFGEGGAGTFSDGKLYTQIRDREHRIPWILRELVKAGAPEDVLINNRPHIGTDRLIKVVRTIREEIIALGGEVRFETRVADVVIEDGAMRAVITDQGETLEADRIVFAIGHSSRDTFEALHRRGVPFEAKPFSIGVRIEHPQSLIDRQQYGRFAGHAKLGAAPYKFVARDTKGRVAYSFCMCPGGLVVASSSEPGTVVTNGMSSYARAESNANAGFMVELRPEDITGESVLRGIEFQRALERKAFEIGGGNYHAPAQLLGDFMRGKPSAGSGKVPPSYEPGVVWTDLREVLPEFVYQTLRETARVIDGKLPGFLLDDAVLTAVETRSSSPVRIPRDDLTFECIGVKNFFPSGEGAGYAGGIISAAADGLRVAERMVARLE
ncbi:MAG: NAD(P)-binding protein [Verrucomicrobia bacterium]|nr:NAD(P)-binding protein [Verrucomicrobiota bacterium]